MTNANGTRPSTGRGAYEQPHAVDDAMQDLEAGILGAIFLEPAALARIRQLLDPRDFADRRHRAIYHAMCDLLEQGMPVDALTVQAVITKAVRAGDVRDATELDVVLWDLQDAAPTAVHVEAHAQLLQEHAARQRLAATIRAQLHRLDVGGVPAAAIAGELAQQLAPAIAGTARRFQLIDDKTIEGLPPIAFLVDGVIPEGAACEIHGPPGCGKSFIALDLALSVAAGVAWLDHAVRRAEVVYASAEGNAGLGQRVRAWKDARGLAEASNYLGVHFITETVPLLEDAAVAELLAAIAARVERPGLVVIDTLARAMAGGDENSAQDMGKLIAATDRVRQVTGAATFLVHHTILDATRERGSSALRGAMDTMLGVWRSDEGVITLKCEKQKDAPEFQPLKLQLVPRAGSCVVETALQQPPDSLGVLSPKMRTALEVLQRDFLDDGASATQWLAASGIGERTFYGVRSDLVRMGYVFKGAGRFDKYVITPKGAEALTANCKVTATVLHCSSGKVTAATPPPFRGGSAAAVTPAVPAAVQDGEEDS